MAEGNVAKKARLDEAGAVSSSAAGDAYFQAAVQGGAEDPGAGTWTVVTEDELAQRAEREEAVKRRIEGIRGSWCVWSEM